MPQVIRWHTSLNKHMKGTMYEKAGLSSLERLIGKSVSSICFLPNYVQVAFEELILTCYTNPVVFITDGRTDYRMPEFKDKLCMLIGKSVQSVAEKPRDGLAIYFDDGDSITISLRFEDASSVEAAMLSERNGNIFDVWRYE
jgi:hypothetical protein